MVFTAVPEPPKEIELAYVRHCDKCGNAIPDDREWEIVDRRGLPHLFDMFPFTFEPSSMAPRSRNTFKRLYKQVNMYALTCRDVLVSIVST